MISRVWEAKASKLSTTICKDTFVAVRDHLRARGYTGPISIACDDSKLLSGLCLHFDARQSKHFLVGGVEGPIYVPEPKDIEQAMADPTISKGTKVSVSKLFCWKSALIPRKAPPVDWCHPIPGHTAFYYFLVW